MSTVGPDLPPLSPTREEFHALASQGNLIPIFTELAADLEATRYHSLVVLERDFPDDLEISARAEDGEIMGLRHRRFPVEGVQFHPESILTSQGKALLGNFLRLTPVLVTA